MWIFTVMSETMIHATLVAGIVGLIAGFVLGFVPFIKRYKLPIQIISILIFSFGVYLQGGLANQKEWQLKVKEAEARASKAEAEMAQKNIELQAALSEKNTVIREKGDAIIKYIDRWRDRDIIKVVQGPERVRIEEVIRYIENCPIPSEFISIHNNATKINQDKEAIK
jgi:hypothetical protein